MNPQGSSPVNDGYFSALITQINSLNDDEACAELQKIVTAASASIQAELTSIRSEISSLTPMTTIPHDLGSVIAWIKSYIAPVITAIATLTAQIEQILQQVGALETAISNAASRLTSCSITIPPML